MCFVHLGRLSWGWAAGVGGGGGEGAESQPEGGSEVVGGRVGELIFERSDRDTGCARVPTQRLKWRGFVVGGVVGGRRRCGGVRLRVTAGG